MKADLHELRSLLPYATLKRKQIIEKALELGSIAAAADALNMSRNSAAKAISKLRAHAAKNCGWNPDDRLSTPIADGYFVRRRSQFMRRDRDEDGNPVGEMQPANQWVITEPDKEEALQRLMEALEDFAANYEGFAEPAPMSPDRSAYKLDDKLLNVIPLGDPHFGLLAWEQETGANFNLSICARNLRAAVHDLLSRSPGAKQCLIVNAGDYFHVDNSEGTTARHKIKQSVDSRRAEMLRVGLETFVYLIDNALRFHEKVHVISECGNHDRDTAMLIPLYLAAWYRNEPRVTIDVSPAAYHSFEFGNVLIGTTHGEKTAKQNLQHIMSCDWPEAWGRTRFRHWYIGHVHHKTLIDLPGCTVETLRVLIPQDGYHHESGYRSLRTLQLDTWHADYGLVDQRVTGISKIQSITGDKD